MNTKIKCPLCGYVFENTEISDDITCPLCLAEKSADDFEIVKDNPTTDNKSQKKIIFEWILFFVSFSAFIFLLYYIISYIISA